MIDEIYYIYVFSFMMLAGMCLVHDAIYSISLYFNAPSYEGSPRQTFKKDHWVRCARGIVGLALIVVGVMCL